MIRRSLLLAVFALASVTCSVAGQQPSGGPQGQAKSSDSTADPSGMYTFLRDGEFVQLTLDDGKLSGFVSRFGDTESDKGEFIDQFFDKAELKENRLSFKTKTVHGIWYEFSGVIGTTSGKKSGQEGYRVLKGTLTQHATDAGGSDKLRQREVEFKSFPQDLSKP